MILLILSSSDQNIIKQKDYQQSTSTTILMCFVCLFVWLSINQRTYHQDQVMYVSLNVLIAAVVVDVHVAVKIDDDETDLDPKQIVYQVKKGPFYGHLLVEDKRSLHFTQQQINDDKVFYIQENMFNDGGEDSFVVDIFQRNNEKIHSNINIPIIVAALVKARKPFVAAFPGLKSLINIDHVDAR